VIQAKHIPSAPLAGLVHCFWYWEGVPLAHEKERLMPNGEPTIIFQLNEERIRIYDWRDPSRFETLSHAILAGPRSQPFVIDTAQQNRVFGIQFCPGGIFPFFREPVREFENRDFDLDLMWHSAANELREQLLEAGSVNAMFRIAETALLARMVRPPELHAAVASAARSFARHPQRAKVADAVENAGMSHRRFLQLFNNQIGMTPKAFSRVRRFQRVLDFVNARPGNTRREIGWVQLALDCGYYDQAHFIHDFQNFSGFTPGVYSTIRGEHANHVPLV
jgi:AraC-like DNA-binding protein